MARSFAKILTSIWADDDFKALGAHDQWVFFLLLSQPDLSLCGVLPYSPKRWSHMAAGETQESVEEAIGRIEVGRLVVVDHETDELWIRTFVRHDGVLEQPNVLIGATRQFDAVHSGRIRAGIIASLPANFEALAQQPYGRGEAAKPLVERLGEPFMEAFRKGLPEPFAEPVTQPLPEPLTNGFAEPFGEPLPKPLIRANNRNPQPFREGFPVDNAGAPVDRLAVEELAEAAIEKLAVDELQTQPEGSVTDKRAWLRVKLRKLRASSLAELLDIASRPSLWHSGFGDEGYRVHLVLEALERDREGRRRRDLAERFGATNGADVTMTEGDVTDYVEAEWGPDFVGAALTSFRSVRAAVVGEAARA